MRIILADDHKIVRQGLKMLLETNSNIKVIGEANNGTEAVELVKKTLPDIVIMDISMPELDGLEATKKIRLLCPNVKVLILSMRHEESYIHNAFKVGVSGYILKDATYEEVLLALKSLECGKIFLSPSISKLIIDRYLLREPINQISINSIDKLTDREKEILYFLSEGYSRQEIAGCLFISPKTVDRHRENIKLKLEMHDSLSFTKLLLSIKSN